MSKIDTRYQRNITSAQQASSSQNTNESIDLNKLIVIFKKSIPHLLLIFALCFVAGIFYIRYNNVKYRSTAELKLNKRSEATLFGFTSPSEESSNLNTLSGEIELIRSKLFLKEVAKNLEINVKYELIGRFKNEERYRFLPFTISYNSSCSSIGRSFYVDILDDNNFKIANTLEDENWQKGSFNKLIEYDGCLIKLIKTPVFFSDQIIKITLLSDENVVDYLGSKLEVAPENLNANTIKIAFLDHNPYKVQKIVSTISELYTEYSKEQKNQANELKINFLNSQLKEVEGVINNYETYIENFTLENKSSDPKRDLSFVIAQINKIDSSLNELKYKKRRLNSLIENFSTDSLKVFNELQIKEFSGLSELLEEHSELKNSISLLKMRYKKGSPTLAKQRLELELLENRIKEYLIAYQDFIEESIDQTKNNRNKLTGLFQDLPAKSNELNQKMRFYSIYEDLYLSLMQRKTEFQIAKAGTVAEVIILTPASYPRSPIGPSNKVLYLAAVIAGIFISILFIIIRYFVHNEIISLSELEKLAYFPIVGIINRVSSRLSKKPGVIVFEKPRSQISESFRSLRTGLNFMGLEKDQQVIAVTSSISGEGKTFVAVNLAAVLSLANKKTIILDLDMRKPRAQYAFNIANNDQGMSAILSGNLNWKECIHTTKNENLHLITSGVIPPNPAELLGSSYFEKLLSELKKAYDIIILDTPPIGLVSDGLIAIKRSDQSLYVVRSDYSKRSFIKELHRNVELNKLQNISLVFNASKNKKYSYGYYQDYYDNNLSRSVFNIKRIFTKE